MSRYLTKAVKFVASCNASGVVRFDRRTPKGNLPIGRLSEDDKAAFTAHCRLAYDGKTWLVPGIPEADNQTEAVDALLRFRERVTRLGLVA